MSTTYLKSEYPDGYFILSEGNGTLPVLYVNNFVYKISKNYYLEDIVLEIFSDFTRLTAQHIIFDFFCDYHTRSLKNIRKFCDSHIIPDNKFIPESNYEKRVKKWFNKNIYNPIPLDGYYRRKITKKIIFELPQRPIVISEG